MLRSDGGGLTTRCHTFPAARAAILTTSPSTGRFTKRNCLFTSPPLHSELSAIAGRYANLSEEMFTHQVRKVLCVTEILEMCGGGELNSARRVSDWVVHTKNPESFEKSRVFRLAAVLSPGCMNSCVGSSQRLPADCGAGRQWNSKISDSVISCMFFAASARVARACS